MESDPKIGIVGILFHNNDPDIVQSYGFRVDSRSVSAEPLYAGRVEQHELPDCIEADYVDGGTTLIRRSVIEQWRDGRETLHLR